MVVGGGAAGFFAAIAAAQHNREARVILLEATHQPLDKVRVSGGGRCNVTHNWFDPAILVSGYPRGGRELLGPFHRFQPRDTVAWFARNGVQIEAEEDGRMFPITDQSSTVVNCLTRAAFDARVEFLEGARVIEIQRSEDAPGESAIRVKLQDGRDLPADCVLLATGNSVQGYQLAASLGHTIVPCVPSLFTFKVTDRRLADLAGISSPGATLQLQVEGEKFEQRGPLLITHWGLSGPAVLKLSAWAARSLAKARYHADLIINWLPSLAVKELNDRLSQLRLGCPRRAVVTAGLEPIPRRLWANLAESAGISHDLTWANLTRENLDHLIWELTAGQFKVTGRGIFKEEFVTCGGVSLKEVDFRTMESRVCAGLHFAGEILDIDGITGGFNFQSAWTTGFIAGESMAVAHRKAST